MKSSFLLVLTLLGSSVAWGQTRSSRPASGTRPTPPSGRSGRPMTKSIKTKEEKKAATVKVQTKVETTAKTEEVSKTEVLMTKSSFQKFSDRLKISYFSAFQSSQLNNWDGQALDEHGRKSGCATKGCTQDGGNGYAHNLFNQIGFNYNFGAKFNFVLNPRFTINTGDTAHQTPRSTSVLQMEDALVGFQGVVTTSEDKKFTWWQRIGARVPMNRNSRASNITYQPDFYSQFTYDFNSKWQLGSYAQLRWWIYNQAYTPRRYRVYVGPYVQYTLGAKDRIAIWYENYSENRSKFQSFNGKKPNFQEYWQNAMISYSRDITPTVNFMPFIGYFLNTDYSAVQKPLDPMWLGFWFSWQIK